LSRYGLVSLLINSSMPRRRRRYPPSPLPGRGEGPEKLRNFRRADTDAAGDTAVSVPARTASLSAHGQVPLANGGVDHRKGRFIRRRTAPIRTNDLPPRSDD
jgi:hypothetical protein